MNENDKKALNRITKQSAKVTQSGLSSIDDLYMQHCYKESKMCYGKQLSRIARLGLLCMYENRDQLRALSCRTQRYRKSFVTNSIHVTNNR